jgi:ATP/ADP translocase
MAGGPVPYDADGGEYHRGDMEIVEQRATYDVFMGMTKWGSVAVIVLVLFLTLTFATGAGWLTALIVSLVVLAASIFLLREKKDHGGSPARPH